MTSISSTSAPSFSWDKISDDMNKDSLKSFLKGAGTIDEERFKGFEHFILTDKWLNSETKERVILRIEKLVIKQNVPLADIATRILILKNIGLLSSFWNLFPEEKTRGIELATHLAHELSSQGASRELKIYFIKKLLDKGFDLCFALKDDDSIAKILNLENSINEIIFDIIIALTSLDFNLVICENNKDGHLNWIENAFFKFLLNAGIDKVILFLNWTNQESSFINYITSSHMHEIVSRLLNNHIDLLYQHLMTMLEKEVFHGHYFFKVLLADKQFSIPEFVDYVDRHSEQKRKVHDRLMSICGPFSLQFPFLSTDTLETKIAVGNQALRENPSLLSLNFSYLFSDQEIVDDLGVNGPIAGLIESCLKSPENENKAYLQLSLMYYQRLLREKTSSPSIERDAHLYLYLGEEPGDGNQNNNVFMTRREYDQNVGVLFRTKNAITRQNASKVNVVISPAIEPLPDYLTQVESPFSYLGFKYLSGSNGAFMILPDAKGLEDSWKELVKLPKYSYLPPSISIAHVQGIVSSRDFVKLYQKHTAVISTDEETHDLKIHFESIVKMIVEDPILYEQVRKLAAEITQEILDVCDMILSNSPTQYDLDMVAFFEDTAGILYDRGTSQSLETWYQEAMEWKRSIPFADYWRTTAEYWRRGLRKRVPNDLDYTPEMISNYWTEKKNLMNLATQT